MMKASNETRNAEDAAYAVRVIRKALLVGLASYGEIERLTEEASALASVGHSFPEGMKPVHPTGAADTVGEFAEALMQLEHLLPAEQA